MPKITELPVAASVTDDDIIPIVDFDGSPTTKRATVAQVRGDPVEVAGTGFWRSVGGTLDPNAQAVDLAGGSTHVTGILPRSAGGTGVDFSGLIGNALKVVRVNAGQTAFELSAVDLASGGVTGILPRSLGGTGVDFSGLIGNALKVVRVNAGQTAFELSTVDLAGSGVTGILPRSLGGTGVDFSGLLGHSLKVIRVNAGETAFELATISSGATPNGSNNDILTSNGAGNFGTPITPASGIATFLATPSSANLRSALTDETGSGAAVFATSPTLSSPTLSGVTTISVTADGTTAYVTFTDGYFSLKTILGKTQTSSITQAHICSYDVPDNCTVRFDAVVVMTKRTTNNKSGTYSGYVIYRRDGGGGLTLVGGPVMQTDLESGTNDVVVFSTSSNTVRVSATAADTDGRNWTCELRIHEVLDT